MSENPVPKTETAIPKSIWALGFVSLFMDIGSEMIHSLLPIFLVSVLGAATTAVGLIEGAAEAIASVTKVFSGAISDYLGKRKLLALIGYGLGALSKPIFAVAPNLAWVSAARFSDRVGKGIRGAPRDALVSDLAPAHLRGAAYGLRQALDTVGAFAGPLLAVLLMLATGGNYRLVFWVAAIPAAFSVFILANKVPERDRPTTTNKRRFPIHPQELQRLGGRYWGLALVAVAFSLARFSEAFLLLRTQNLGLTAGMAPLVLVVMNLVYSASAYPVGKLSDRIGRVGLLAGGYLVFAIAHLTLAISTVIWQAIIGAAIWGLHMGMTQGLLATLIADSVPEELRGTAFGMFNLLTGTALLPASFAAGLLWDSYGAATPFYAGAVLAFTAMLGLLVWQQRHGD